MEQYTEILTHMLQNRPAKIEVTFPDLSFSANEIVEAAAYHALVKIQEILRDESLNDKDCFRQIEAIVHELELIGLDCGNRHNFG